MSQFRFTDQEWSAYQAIPDQGYSHRGWLENLVNTKIGRTYNMKDLAIEKVMRLHHEFREGTNKTHSTHEEAGIPDSLLTEAGIPHLCYTTDPQCFRCKQLMEKTP